MLESQEVLPVLKEETEQRLRELEITKKAIEKSVSKFKPVVLEILENQR